MCFFPSQNTGPGLLFPAVFGMDSRLRGNDEWIALLVIPTQAGIQCLCGAAPILTIVMPTGWLGCSAATPQCVGAGKRRRYTPFFAEIQRFVAAAGARIYTEI